MAIFMSFLYVSLGPNHFHPPFAACFGFGQGAMPLPSDAPPSVQVPSLPPAFHSTWPPRPGNGSNGEFHIYIYIVCVYIYIFIYRESVYIYIYYCIYIYLYIYIYCKYIYTIYIYTLYIYILYTINYTYTKYIHIQKIYIYIYEHYNIYSKYKYIYLFIYIVCIYIYTIYTYTYTRCGSAFALQKPWSLFIDAFGWPQRRLLTNKFYAQGQYGSDDDTLQSRLGILEVPKLFSPQIVP